jgi:hypothetical protein
MMIVSMERRMDSLRTLKESSTDDRGFYNINIIITAFPFSLLLYSHPSKDTTHKTTSCTNTQNSCHGTV